MGRHRGLGFGLGRRHVRGGGNRLGTEYDHGLHPGVGVPAGTSTSYGVPADSSIGRWAKAAVRNRSWFAAGPGRIVGARAAVTSGSTTTLDLRMQQHVGGGTAKAESS